MSERSHFRSLVEQFPRREPDHRLNVDASSVAAKRSLLLAASLVAHASVVAALSYGGGHERALHDSVRQAKLEVPAPELLPAPLADEANPPPVAAAAPVTVRERAPVRALGRATGAQASAPSIAPPASVVATELPAPRFVMAAVPALSAREPRAGILPVASVAQVSVTPLREREVDVAARLLAGAPPRYTASAQAAGIEASVPLEIVVDARGAVESATPLEHVGYGLDEAALRAVRAFRFAPARRAGQPVAVRMRWTVRFELD